MAKQGPKGRTRRGPVVTPLEHAVPVTWQAVGSREWLDQAWAPGGLLPEQQVEIVTAEDLQPVLDFLWTLRVCGVDTETAGPYKAGDRNYGMNPLNRDTRIVLLQLGNEERVFLIQPEFIPYFKDYLESDQVLHVGHNLIYDFKWLLVKYGVHLQRLYCSMLAEQLLTAGLMGERVALSDAVRRRAPHWIINKAVRDHFIHLGHVTGCPDCEGHPNKVLTQDMGYYAARDIVLLFPLMREQTVELKHWQLQRVAQAEFDIIPATAEMELEGVDLSLPIMRQIIEYWTQKEQSLAAEFFTLYFKERKKAGATDRGLLGGLDIGFKLTANAAKLQALRELDIDLDNIQRSTLKEASKDKDLTEAQRRLLLILAEFSAVSKMTTTYGKNMVDKISPVTGRWHPKFKQLGSGEEEGRKSGSDKSTIATGRFSSDAQQFPKPKELFAPVTQPVELQHVLAHFAPQIATLTAASAA